MKRTSQHSSTFRRAAGALAIATIIAACGGSDSDESSPTADTAVTSDAGDGAETDVEPDATDTETETETDAESGGDACPAAPFDGTIERADDSGGAGHTAATYSGPDFTETDIVGFGDDYTIYLSDQPIEGFTVEAPAGGVVVTIFITGRTSPVEPGTVLTVDEERSEFLLIVDNSGSAVSSNAAGGSGTVEVISASDSAVCFSIDYSDDFRTVSGTVSAAA